MTPRVASTHGKTRQRAVNHIVAPSVTETPHLLRGRETGEKHTLLDIHSNYVPDVAANARVGARAARREAQAWVSAGPSDNVLTSRSYGTSFLCFRLKTPALYGAFVHQLGQRWGSGRGGPPTRVSPQGTWQPAGALSSTGGTHSPRSTAERTTAGDGRGGTRVDVQPGSCPREAGLLSSGLSWDRTAGHSAWSANGHDALSGRLGPTETSAGPGGGSRTRCP